MFLDRGKTLHFFYKGINKAFSWQFDAVSTLICGQCYEGYDEGVTVGLSSCSPQNPQHLARAKTEEHLEMLILPGINDKNPALQIGFTGALCRHVGK